ncbi:MAG: DNA repair exonuclease [Alphaproteobacteria bacterium]|nr:DNA repair exonuclease [Alphaproteobacteria bacterium]
MAITFIHTADWQIGKAFGRFDLGLAERLRDARLNAIDQISGHARKQNAAHILVAGDVWDHELPSDQLLNWTLERMAGASTLTWWLLPGNHDPARPNGLWQRLGPGIALPQNVKPLLAPTPTEISDNVFVLPAPLMSKDPGRDLTQWMTDGATPEGAIRIGLAHGSTEGFGSGSGQNAVIDPRRAQSAKLDYLALGDWHGKKQINERTWYAGTPEPDQFPRNDPGWCLAVTIDRQGATPKVTPLRTATFTWIAEDVDVRSGMSSDDILHVAQSSNTTAQKTLIELTLRGRIRVQDTANLHCAVAKKRDAFAYFEVREDGLQTLIDTRDLDRLDHAGSLRVAADTLKAQADDASRTPDQRQDAHQALTLLYTLAQSNGGFGA